MLRRRLRWAPALLALLAVVLSCRRVPSGPSSGAERAIPEAPVSIVTTTQAAAPGPGDLPDFTRGCLTLRDVAASDVVRVDGSTLYYLDEASGLWLVDVSDAEHPHVASHVAHVGSPRYLFVRDGIAWVVFIDWDGRKLPQPTAATAATVVRTVDVRDPEHPLVVGEEAREGVVHDARLVGGLLYLLRDTQRGSVVEALGLRQGTLAALGRVALEGHGVELAASSAGLAAITTRSDAVGVTWFDLPVETPGAIELRGDVLLRGTIAAREEEGARLSTADDGQTVHVVTCATTSCGSRDGSRVHVVDFGVSPPRVGESALLADTGGLPLTRFQDDRLYAGTTTGSTTGSSELRIVTLYPSPRLAGKLALRGTLTTLVPRDGTLVALGRIPASEDRARLVVHDIDVRRPEAPRLRGTVTFGSDWTWSVVEGNEAALSFDPSTRLGAFPFTAVRGSDQRYGVGTQIVDFTARGPRLGPMLRAESYVERAVFVGGRLLAIGPEGIETIDYAHGPVLRQENADSARRIEGFR